MKNYRAHNKGKSKYDIDFEKMKELIKEGYSIQQLSELTEIPYHSLYNQLRINKIEIPNVRNKRTKDLLSKARTVYEISKEELERLYIEEKQTLNQISELFDCSPATIFHKMNSYGIEKRDYSESGKLRFINNPDEREKYRTLCLNRTIGIFRNQERDYKDTMIEQMFREWSKENKIEINEQYQIEEDGHPYDFYIKEINLLVEVDGEYWHNKPKQIIKDEKQIDKAEELGYNVIRFSDKQIYKSKMKCFNIILEMLNDQRRNS